MELKKSGPDLGETMTLSNVFCPVVMCLVNVIADAEARSRGSGDHLRTAVGHLGLGLLPEPFPRGERGASANVLATYLEFLLPEISPRSEAAALSVRRAIFALRDHERDVGSAAMQ